MDATRGARDGFVHERSTQIIGARLQTDGGALCSHLDPRRLDILDQGMERQPRYRMHEHGFPESRTAARTPLPPQRSLHMYVGKRHEFGNSSSPRLQRTKAQQMSRPVCRALHMPEHNGRRGTQADLVSRFHHLQPFIGP